MREKVVGYSLLIFGIFLILFALLRVSLVFTGKTEPIQLINPSSSLGINMSMPSDIAGQNIKVPVELGQLGPLISLVNNLVYLIFMGFIASIGFKIALLGVNLIRPIVVRAKQEPIKTV